MVNFLYNISEDTIFKFILQGSSGFVLIFPPVLFSAPHFLSTYLFPISLFFCFPYLLLISTLSSCRFSYLFRFIGTCLLFGRNSVSFSRIFSYVSCSVSAARGIVKNWQVSVLRSADKVSPVPRNAFAQIACLVGNMINQLFITSVFPGGTAYFSICPFLLFCVPLYHVTYCRRDLTDGN
jgi:hypothetical protein